MSLKETLIKGARFIGMDGAIAYSSAARIFQGVAGIGTMFFISTFLSGVEQGFYFTFGSILALQVFFELGLTGIMTQYVAHEVSHLHLNNKREYEGEQKYLSRLASLVRFCFKWYTVLAIIIYLFLIIVGFVYFARYGDSQAADVNWRVPWLIIATATSIQVFISPFTSILTGLGFVKEMSKVSFYQQVIMPLCIWVGLACGAKLYVSGIAYFFSSVVWFYAVNKSGLIKILVSLSKVEIKEKVSYLHEVFPYQWKIALSWISGYFIFQLFNPVLFATEGAVVAGQMGMTLTALNAVQAFAMSWQNTKIPRYSNFIAMKQYDELNTLFNKTLKQMFFMCMFLLCGMFTIVFVFNITHFSIGGSLIGERFLSYVPMALMMIPLLANMFVFSWATYLRCHKQEPFLVNSVTMGILCCLSTLVLGRLYGVYGITIGYCCLTLFVALPWGYKIYFNKKKIWHNIE